MSEFTDDDTIYQVNVCYNQTVSGRVISVHVFLSPCVSASLSLTEVLLSSHEL